MSEFVQWLIVWVFLSASVFAQQVVTGAVAGTITDPDGHPVPRIAVQAANAATKVVYRSTSSEVGEYSIAQLPPGTYQLTTQVSPVAFQPFVRENLRIAPGKQSNSTFGWRKA